MLQLHFMSDLLLKTLKQLVGVELGVVDLFLSYDLLLVLFGLQLVLNFL
jgi:hypothetical protein